MLGVILGDLVISWMNSGSEIGPAKSEMERSNVAGHGLSSSLSSTSTKKSKSTDPDPSSGSVSVTALLPVPLSVVRATRGVSSDGSSMLIKNYDGRVGII
jgi:hypothetical protein